MKKKACVFGIIIGALMVLVGIFVFFAVDCSVNFSIPDEARFGGDFFTEEYNATRTIAKNTYYTGINLASIGEDISKAMGIFVSLFGCAVICFFSYKLEEIKTIRNNVEYSSTSELNEIIRKMDCLVEKTGVLSEGLNTINRIIAEKGISESMKENDAGKNKGIAKKQAYSMDSYQFDTEKDEILKNRGWVCPDCQTVNRVYEGVCKSCGFSKSVVTINNESEHTDNTVKGNQRLDNLKKLFDMGVISREEYEAGMHKDT